MYNSNKICIGFISPNYTTLVKEIKWEPYCVYGLKHQYSNIAKLPQVDVYRFNSIPIIMKARYVTVMYKIILKFILKIKATKIVKTIFKKKNKMGDLIYMVVRPIM